MKIQQSVHPVIRGQSHDLDTIEIVLLPVLAAFE